MIKDQRVKLTKSNFQVGHSPIGYGSSSHDVHTNKPVTFNDPSKRNMMRDTNNATNFIDKETRGFEAKKTPGYTTDEIPRKSVSFSLAEQKRQEDLVKDLKASHFRAGTENGAKYPSNTCYGSFGHTGTGNTVQRGQGQPSHFILGTDN